MGRLSKKFFRQLKGSLSFLDNLLTSVVTLFLQQLTDFLIDLFAGKTEFFIQHFCRGGITEVIDSVYFPLLSDQAFQRNGKTGCQAVFQGGLRQKQP